MGQVSENYFAEGMKIGARLDMALAFYELGEPELADACMKDAMCKSEKIDKKFMDLIQDGK